MDYQKTKFVICSKPSTSLENNKSVYQAVRHYDNIAHTLDNSVILDQQLETLNHHKKMLEAKKMRELLQQDPIYQNDPIPVSAALRSNSTLIYSNICHENSGYKQTTNLDDEDDLDELPPPPSPVSSSYSELTRTILRPSNCNMNEGDAVPRNEVQKKVQLIQQNQQKLLAAANNSKYPIVTGNPATIISNSDLIFNQQPSSASRNSYSNYESIYEPINPRPQSLQYPQNAIADNYPHVGYSRTPLSSASSSYSASQYGQGKEQDVDILTDLLVRSLHTGENPNFKYHPSIQNPMLINHHYRNIQGVTLSTPPLCNDYEQIPGDQYHGDNFGTCVKCNARIIGENSGCTAMDQIYHIECFTCCQCQINLQGKPFYPIDNQPYCEDDYLNTLEKCSVCVKPILERILRATGKPYHPQCFCCIVCGKSLDGIPFTVDATNQIHCIEDFHKKFAPRCCVCCQPIMPEPGNEEETVRVVAMDRSFHITCYKCEDCSLLLSSESEGRGCYPLDDHVLCKSCNAKRVQNMTTEL